jgi:hypothetical protein
MTELCLFLADGIKKLSDGPFSLYVPAMDWDIIQDQMGRSVVYEHLVTADSSQGQGDDNRLSAEAVILKILDVAADDFSPEVPLTTYGLDSLSAARLSYALRPLVQITQMQLLADMALKDIEAKIAVIVEEEPETAEESKTSAPAVAKSTTEDLMKVLVERYSGRFTLQRPSVLSSSPSGSVVVLTGSTGAVGCAALAQLAASADIVRIYALNRRAADGTTLADRQLRALKEQGFSLNDEQWTKIKLVEAEFHKEKLGIADDLYEEVSTISSSTSQETD